MDQNILLAVALVEFVLALLIIRQGRAIEYLVFFVLALMIQPHSLAAAPLLIAGGAGYAASLLWRVIALNWRRLTRVRLWLARHGYERGLRPSPSTPVLIAGGTSLALLVPDAFSLAALIGLVIATATTSFEWRGERGGYPIRGMSIAASANVVGLAFLLAVAGVTLQWATPQSASDVLPQLVAVQIALGLLPLTAITVATQFVAGAAGAGAAGVLPWRRAVAVVGLVLTSIAYDFYLLASPVGVGDLEWAETIALASIGVSMLTSAYVAYFLRLGWVAHALVERLSSAWLDEVARKYQEPYQPWFGPEPFRDLERLLYLAATRDSDIRLFRGTIAEIDERIRTLVRRRPPADPWRVEMGLDEHVARNLSALLDDAARQRKPWVLESLIWFREELSDTVMGVRFGQTRPPHTQFLERTGYADAPSGLQLLAAVVEAAIDGGLVLEGRRAAYRAARYVVDRLAALPDPTGVWEIDPNAPVKFQAEAPAQHASDVIEDVLRVFSNWADRAAAQGVYEMGVAAADTVATLTGASRELSDPRWARWLAREGVMRAFSIAQRGLRAGQLWYELPTRHQDYARANQSHVEVVDAMSFWVPYTIATCAPVASYMLIVSATMLGLAWIREFPEEAGTIAAALEYIKRRRGQLPPTDDGVVVLREVDQRLQQLRGSVGAGGEAFDRVRAAFLARLIQDLEAAPASGGGEVF